MLKYKLSRKESPLNPEKKGQWHAEPAPVSTMETDEFCRMVTTHTTLSPFELKMGLELISTRLPNLLLQGIPVRLGRLGTLRVEFGSEGVEEPEDFAARLIRRPRVVFRPSKELASAIRQGAHFEAGGIQAEGVWFASIDSYREWQAKRDTPSAPVP